MKEEPLEHFFIRLYSMYVCALIQVGPFKHNKNEGFGYVSSSECQVSRSGFNTFQMRIVGSAELPLFRTEVAFQDQPEPVDWVSAVPIVIFSIRARFINCSSASTRVVYKKSIHQCLIHNEQGKRRHPQKSFQIYSTSVQGSVELINRVFNSIVLCHKIDESAGFV